MKLDAARRARAGILRRTCALALAGVLIITGLSACGPGPKPTCSGGTEDYKGTCVPQVTAEYLACIQDRGFSSSTEVSAGVPLLRVADSTVQVAYKKSKEEDSTVSLQVVRDCLTLAEQAATPGTDRGAARQYAQQAARDIAVVRQRLPAIEVDPQGTLDCGTASIDAQVTCQVTIKSTGVTALHITGTEMTGANSGDFTADGECLGAPLDPDQACTMTIQFHPSASGERNATLVIHQNLPPPDHGTTLELTGTGKGTPPTTQTHLLTVTVHASATVGGVSSSPPGITGCRDVCTGTFDDGTDITLTATYSQGSGQVIWEGCNTTSGDTCTVHLIADRAVTARLSPILG